MAADRSGRIVLGVKGPPSPGPLAWVAAQAASWSRPVLVLHAWIGPAREAHPTGAVPWLDVDVWPESIEEPGLAAAATLCELGVAVETEICCDAVAPALLSLLEAGDEVVLGSAQSHGWQHLSGSTVVHRGDLRTRRRGWSSALTGHPSRTPPYSGRSVTAVASTVSLTSSGSFSQPRQWGPTPMPVSQNGPKASQRQRVSRACVWSSCSRAWATEPPRRWRGPPTEPAP